MTAEWAIQVDDNGWVFVTLGPKPRRTVSFPPDEARLFAMTLVKMANVAEDVHGKKDDEPPADDYLDDIARRQAGVER